MRPIIKEYGKGIATTAHCAKCDKELPYLHYTNKHGVPCYDPRVIIWNYCPNCGEEIEGYRGESE